MRRLQNQSSATERSNDSPNRSPGSADRSRRSPGSNSSPPGSNARTSYPSKSQREVAQSRRNENTTGQGQIPGNDQREETTIPLVNNSAPRIVDISNMGQVSQSVHDPHVSDRRRPTVNDSADLHLSSEWGVSSPIGGGSVARSAAGIRSSHGFIMMSSDFIIDIFNANCASVLEIGRQL